MGSILDELESLLFDWEEGALDDEGVERVRELLRTSQPARDYFLQQQSLNAALKLDADARLPLAPEGDGSQATSSATRDAPRDSARAFRVSYWAAAAAVLLTCALAGRWLQLEIFGPQRESSAIATTDTQRNEPMSEGVALITRLVDVQWGRRQAPLEVGDPLRPGLLTIAAGFAQIEFFCGATVIVEGPAELDLQSPLLARVRMGRLRAQVPPAARGFSLEADDLKVVDLGTEFGLSVSDDGANLQVFDGEVELQQSESPKRLLAAGHAVTRDATGQYTETDVTPDQFLDIAALESRAAGQRDERYRRWRAWSAKARQDKRLIAYYALDEPDGWQRRLSSSIEPQDTELDGAIVGAHRVAGRWLEKGALEFKRPGDRVRVQIPGEFRSLTFACWVKIDSLDRWYNSLFLTDHYNQGEPHWQILDTGQLFFSVRHKADKLQGAAARKATHQPVLSPPFWQPSMSGRWLHLATTYDATAGRTSHYLNGELLHQESIDAHLQVKKTRIGAASIGNWSIPTKQDAEFAIRNLNGAIDEFAIFAAALSADEVKEMYEHGKP